MNEGKQDNMERADGNNERESDVRRRVIRTRESDAGRARRSRVKDWARG